MTEIELILSFYMLLGSTSCAQRLTVGDGRRRHEELVKNEDAPHVVSSRRGWTERVVDWTTRIFYDLISDFTDDPDPVVNRNTHDLTVKRSVFVCVLNKSMHLDLLI